MKKIKSILCAVVAFSVVSLFADHHLPSLEGVWHGAGTLPDGGGISETTLTIKKESGKLSAVSVNAEGEARSIDRIKVNGVALEIEIDVGQGDQRGIIGVKAKLDDKGVMNGKWYIRGNDGTEYALENWQAVRALSPDLAGSWNIVAKTEEGDKEHQVDFTKSGSGFDASVKFESGRAEFTKAKVDKNKLRLELPYGEGQIKVEALYRSENRLVGKWVLFNSSNQEESNGAWSASKVDPGAAIIGEWAIELSFGGDVRDSRLVVTRNGDGFDAVYISPRSGKHQCDSVTFENEKLVVTLNRDIQGNDVDLILSATLNEDGGLSGTMVAKGQEDQFRAEWTAKRK